MHLELCICIVLFFILCNCLVSLFLTGLFWEIQQNQLNLLEDIVGRYSGFRPLLLQV